MSPPDLDWRVLTFTTAMTGIVVLLATVWPALRGSRVGRLPNLTVGGKVTVGSPETRRVSFLMQVTQVSLTLLLVTTAAAFATSLSRLLTADLGFDPRGLVGADVTLPAARYATPEARVAAMDELLARLRATPGVVHAAIGSSPPRNNVGRMVWPGGPPLAPNRINADVRFASPGYFEATGVPLVAGREFVEADGIGAPMVAIIDETGARKAFPGESPLGKTFNAGPNTPDRTIVGVARSVAGMTFPADRSMIGLYFPQRQSATHGSMTLLVRSTARTPEIASMIQTALTGVDPALKAATVAPVSDFFERTMETYATPRYYVALIGTLAAVALFTAAIGLYGALAFAVRQREREIGIRMALGSGTRNIRTLVLGAVLRPVVVGALISSGVIWFSGGVIQSLLYSVNARDPRFFAAGAVILVLVAGCAAIIPLRRAERVRPIEALRSE